MPSADYTPSPFQRRLPNLLTVGRLVLTIAFVAVLSVYRYPDTNAWALPAALVIFIVAAITDALDGYFARKWNAISVFGRVVDPAADKILILGTLVFLASPAFLPSQTAEITLTRVVTGVAPWMVVVILARELMVTSIRAVLESAGVSFAANTSGKIKMILQSVAAPLAMLVVWLAPMGDLDTGGWARWTLDLLFWGVTLLTIGSSLPYAVGLLTHMSGQTSVEEIKP